MINVKARKVLHLTRRGCEFIGRDSTGVVAIKDLFHEVDVVLSCFLILTQFLL